MKSLITIICLIVLAFPLLAQSNFEKSFNVTVTNPSAYPKHNALVIVPWSDLSAVTDFNSDAFIVTQNGKEIPSQIIRDANKGIVFVADQIASKEKQEFVIKYNTKGKIVKSYPKRTQAELSYKTGGEWKNQEYIGGDFKNTDYLRVPKEHKDHSWFIRYEGPGWESDKVGYRFYLDQRNATDVFGKLTPEMTLQNIGLDGFDSYHNMQPWGMDVMKVGKSLGIGSIGSFYNGTAIRVQDTDSVDCRITDNGNLYSSILTRYYGWKIGDRKTNLESTITIHAGTRLTHQQLLLSQTLDNICTGIGRDKNAILLKSEGDKNHFGYIATYGKQSLNNDDLGLVVFFNPSHLKSFASDEFSHIVTLKPDNGKVDYYFAALWSKEPDGITNQSEFEKYLEEVAENLASPIKIEVSTRAVMRKDNK